MIKENKELTPRGRAHISKGNFVFPKERRYPIDTPNRARNALARVSQFGTSTEKAKVRSAVHSKYPGIGKKAMLQEAYTAGVETAWEKLCTDSSNFYNEIKLAGELPILGLGPLQPKAKDIAKGTVKTLSKPEKKEKDIEIATNIAKITAPIGAGVGLIASYRYKSKIIDFLKKHVIKREDLRPVYDILIPGVLGVGGAVTGVAAGAAGTSLSDIFRKSNKGKKHHAK